MERTLSIIKPHAISDGNMGHIISRFEKEGVYIIAAKLIHLTKERAEGFYIEHKGSPFFEELIQLMTSGPILLMVLQADEVVKKNREIMGSTNPMEAKDRTLRKLYAKSIGENAVHGSDSLESAEREINYFFESDEIFSK